MFPLKIEEDNICFYCIAQDEPISIAIEDINDDKLKVLYEIFISDLEEEQAEDFEIRVSYDGCKNKFLLKELIKRTKDLKLIIHVKNHKEFLDFMNCFSDEDITNVFIDYQYTSDCSNFYDYKNMINKVNSIIDSLNMYDLSQLELITIVYDIVKAHNYKEVDKNNPAFSRSLHYVVNSDNFVCAGFSNYFNFILNEMGIKSDGIILEYDDLDGCHQRSIVNVDDNKYDVKGIFVFDPTFDCNRDGNYLNNYRYFMQNVVFFKMINRSESIKNGSFSHDLFSVIKNKNKDFSDFDFMELGGYTKTLNYINRFAELGFERVLYPFEKDSEYIKEKVEQCCEVVNCYFSYEEFMRLLYNVRKVEYELGICKKPNKKEIRDITLNKYCDIFKVCDNKDSILYLRLLFEIDSFDYCFKDSVVRKKK